MIVAVVAHLLLRLCSYYNIVLGIKFVSCCIVEWACTWDGLKVVSCCIVEWVCTWDGLKFVSCFIVEWVCTWDGLKFVSCCIVQWLLSSSLRNVCIYSPSNTVRSQQSWTHMIYCLVGQGLRCKMSSLYLTIRAKLTCKHFVMICVTNIYWRNLWEFNFFLVWTSWLKSTHWVLIKRIYFYFDTWSKLFVGLSSRGWICHI
jgi:hypothetical protein